MFQTMCAGTSKKNPSALARRRFEEPNTKYISEKKMNIFRLAFFEFSYIEQRKS